MLSNVLGYKSLFLFYLIVTFLAQSITVANSEENMNEKSKSYINGTNGTEIFSSNNNVGNCIDLHEDCKALENSGKCTSSEKSKSDPL